MVLIAAPPPPRRPRPLYARLPLGTALYRIYDPTRHRATATAFRFIGPLLRFDHHAAAERRGIYYAAPSLESCVVEVFGDLGVVEFGTRRVARATLQRELLLLDLRQRGAMRAGTVVAVATADYGLSQEWSRYFYEQRDIYGSLDGLLYANAHNGADALALYERAEDALVCPPENDWTLDDPVVETELRWIAHANNLIVD